MNTYSVGSLFLLGRKTAYLLFAPFWLWIKIARDAGYKGIEWWPLRRYFVASIQLAIGLVSKANLNFFSSLHQSYLGERSFKEARASENPAAIPSFIALARRYLSLDRIYLWEARYFGDNLPVVVYPPDRVEWDLFPQRFHIIDKVVKDWDIHSVAELILWSKRQNLRFVFDTAHSRDVGLGHWRTFWPLIQDYTDEVHVRLSLEETSDLLFGIFQTDLVRILKLIGKSGWRGLVVVEVPIDELMSATEYRRRLLVWPGEVSKTHKQLLGIIQELMEEV